MSRNIYDVFNERKSGLDSLLEGSEQYEEFDTVEEAAYAMEEIIQEDANACIEYQAASYLEDLVLENLMFNAFDEENTEELIYESLKSRAEGVVGRIKAAWERVKEWFKGILHTIATALGKTAEWAYNNEERIEKAIPECAIKVKMIDYYDFRTGINNFKKMINVLHTAGKSMSLSKDGILGKIGVKSRENVPEAVKKCFIKADAKEVMIKQLNASVVLDWAICKDFFMDEVNQLKAATDKRFATIISALEKHSDGGEKAAHLYDNFTFINGLINTMTSNMVTIVKKGCSDHFQIARKAVSKMNVVVNAKNKAGAAIKNAVVGESYEYDEDDEYLEEGFGNKFRKLGIEELEEKIEQLKAAVADIEEGNGPKKFLKKAKSELKEAQRALANKQKKAGKAEARAEKKAAKAEAKAAKKAAKHGGEMPAAESFMVDLDEIEFDEE